MWPWEISLGPLKCIYILPYPAIIPPKPSPSSFHSFPFSPPSSTPCLTLIYHSQYPSWSLWSPSFISSCWFSRAVSATTPWRRCGYWRQAYGGLGTPPVHITPHEQPRGRRKGKKKKQSGQSQIAFSYHRGLSSSLCTLSLFFSFPSALFSIRKALFLNVLGPMRTTLEKKTKRWKLASFPHVISLISPTHTHTHRHPHCCHHALLPRVATFIFPSETFVISCDPWRHTGWIGKNPGREV